MKYEVTAKRIKEAMSDKGITQQELADKSKIGKSSISHYVNGSNEPGNKSAFMMAKVLDVNPGWLMGLDVPKHENNEIASFFNDLLNSESDNQKEIDEVKAIMEKATAEKTSKAFKMYDLYLNAPAHIQSAVESLLKGSQQN